MKKLVYSILLATVAVPAVAVFAQDNSAEQQRLAENNKVYLPFNQRFGANNNYN